MFLPVSLLALTLCAIPLTSATPTPIYRRSNCTNPTLRKEWRTLSRDEQINYVEAVNCLTTKPSRIGLSSPLYDDFPYVHNQLNNESKFFNQNTAQNANKENESLLINRSSFRSVIPSMAQILRPRLRNRIVRMRLQRQRNVSLNPTYPHHTYN